MGRPLKAVYANATYSDRVQEMSNTDILNLSSSLVANYVTANTPLYTVLRINDSNNFASSIGTVVDSNQGPVGSAPSYSNTTTTFSIRAGTTNIPTNIARPVQYTQVGNEIKIQEISDSDLITYFFAPIVNYISSGGQGSYFLGPTLTGPPGTGTWSSVGTVNDTYYILTVLTTVQHTLWQRTDAANTSGTIRPLKQIVSGTITKLIEMTDQEIGDLGAYIGEYIRTTGIGQYVIQPSAPGSGTWLDRGSFTDTNNTSAQTGAYIGGYIGTFSGGFTGTYTGAYTGFYEGTYNQFFTGFFTQQFTGIYTGIYTGAFSSGFTGAFSGSYTGAFSGDYTGAFTREFTGVYTRAFTSPISASYTGNFAGSYVGTFAQYTGVYIGPPVGFTSFYIGPTYSSLPPARAGTTYTGSYQGGTFNLYDNPFQQALTDPSTGQPLFLNYTATFADNYTEFFQGPQIGYNSFTQITFNRVAFTGVYTTTPVFSGSRNYMFTGLYNRQYTGFFTGSYSGSFSRAFTGSFSKAFTGSYSQLFTGSFSNAFTGIFTGGYNQSFTRPFTLSFTGAYSGAYSKAFTGVYGNSFTRNLAFTGIYTGLAAILCIWLLLLVL